MKDNQKNIESGNKKFESEIEERLQKIIEKKKIESEALKKILSKLSDFNNKNNEH